MWRSRIFTHGHCSLPMTTCWVPRTSSECYSFYIPAAVSSPPSPSPRPLSPSTPPPTVHSHTTYSSSEAMNTLLPLPPRAHPCPFRTPRAHAPCLLHMSAPRERNSLLRGRKCPIVRVLAHQAQRCCVPGPGVRKRVLRLTM